MHNSPIRQLLPNAIELGYVALTTFVLILAGNGKLMLERMGIIGSANLIGQQVTTKATSGLVTLSNFRATANAINLVVWGAIGLIIYSALQSIVKGLHTIQYERDLAQQYVHPQGFTRQAYWRQIIASTIFGFTLLTLLVVGVILYVVVLIPASFAYLQRFILHPDLKTLADPFLSLAAAFIGTAVVYVLIKLVIRHHRATTIVEE
ncbi:MAG TPA: hypothetical protein VMB52_02985 [Verrucomicrobiae bacterium]|nr:hypothetical protein [Verrucomicrobiae bacterium]